MEEREVQVDHSTINRWVITYSPQVEAAFHRRKQPVWSCCGSGSDARGAPYRAGTGPRLGRLARPSTLTSPPPCKHPCCVVRGWPTVSLDPGAQRRMPTLDLHQRIAVVTGAAQGIGRAIAARLLTAGAAVCLWDRAPEALTSTAHDLTALGPGGGGVVSVRRL